MTISESPKNTFSVLFCGHRVRQKEYGLTTIETRYIQSLCKCLHTAILFKSVLCHHLFVFVTHESTCSSLFKKVYLLACTYIHSCLIMRTQNVLISIHNCSYTCIDTHTRLLKCTSATHRDMNIRTHLHICKHHLSRHEYSHTQMAKHTL